MSSSSLQQAFREVCLILSHSWFIYFCSLQVPIHSSGIDIEQATQELQQLRETVIALTAQCAQLDEANRGWQLYHQAQLDSFRTKFLDCLPIDETLTLDQTAERIVDQISKEREEFSEKYQALGKVNDDLRSGSSYIHFIIHRQILCL